MTRDVGLELLYEPRGTPPLADIVFVHGLNGHRRKTWTKELGTGRSSVPQVSSPSVQKAGKLSRLRDKLSGRTKRSQSIQGKDGDQESSVEAEALLDGEMSSDTSRRSNVLWPQDLLPRDLPGCRIFTWGYDVDLTVVRQDTSTATVYTHAKTLLSDLTDIRMTREEKALPLIFVAHSLGGIIVKDAVNISKHETSHVNEILPAAHAIVFLGVPHRGSSKASLAETLSRIIQTWGGAPNMSILQALKYNAETLDRVHTDFKLTLLEHGIKVRTFHEGLDYKGFTIVDRFSSTLDLPGETPTDILANHVDMTKYTSREDSGYVRVSRALIRWVTELQQSRSEDSKFYDKMNRECLQSLRNTERGSRTRDIEKPYEGTYYPWLYSNEVSFKSWLQSPKAHMEPIYWISGKPGSGKSTLMKFALTHKKTRELLRESLPADWKLLSFFFYDRGANSQKTCLGLLQEILLQLLENYKELIPLVYGIRLKSTGQPLPSQMWEYETSESIPWDAERISVALSIIRSTKTIAWPFKDCVRALEIIAQQSLVPIRACLFIDALDEHKVDRHENHHALLQIINSLAHGESNSSVQLKVCVASRPEVAFRVAFRSCPSFQIHLHTEADIRTYTNGRIESSLMLGDATSIEKSQVQALATAICERAEGVFVWVKLVITELIDSFNEGDSISHLRRILETLPRELKDLYRRIIATRKPDHVEEFRIMCTILHAVTKPLTLVSLMAATQLATTSDWEETSTERLKSRLSSRSGGLIEVNERRVAVEMDHKNQTYIPKQVCYVQFIHQTFKEYLLSSDEELSYATKSMKHSVEEGCLHLLRLGVYVGQQGDNKQLSASHSIFMDLFKYASVLNTASTATKRAAINLLDQLVEPHDSGTGRKTGLSLWIKNDRSPNGRRVLTDIQDQSTERQGRTKKIIEASEDNLLLIAASYSIIFYVDYKIRSGMSSSSERDPLFRMILRGFQNADSVQHNNGTVDTLLELLDLLFHQRNNERQNWPSVSSHCLQWMLEGFRRVYNSGGISGCEDYMQKISKVLEWLLLHDADPNMVSNQYLFVEVPGHHNLVWFARSGVWCYSLFEMLLKYGANPMLEENASDRQLLHYNMEIEQNTSNHLALYYAIADGQNAIAELLCKHGADPTDLGSGLNALQLLSESIIDASRNFIPNAGRMQNMLRKYAPKESSLQPPEAHPEEL